MPLKPKIMLITAGYLKYEYLERCYLRELTFEKYNYCQWHLCFQQLYLLHWNNVDLHRHISHEQASYIYD